MATRSLRIEQQRFSPLQQRGMIPSGFPLSAPSSRSCRPGERESRSPGRTPFTLHCCRVRFKLASTQSIPLGRHLSMRPSLQSAPRARPTVFSAPSDGHALPCQKLSYPADEATPMRGRIRRWVLTLIAVRSDRSRSPMATPTTNCTFCGHPGSHARTDRPDSGGVPFCEECDRCWAERQNSEKPPHHS